MNCKKSPNDNISIKVNKDSKDEFLNWCEGAGISATGAVNLFIKAVLRTAHADLIYNFVNINKKIR